MKRILLLDDSPTIQRVVTLSFTAEKGYDVKVASNVGAAEEFLKNGNLDALIGYVRFSGELNPDFYIGLGLPKSKILLLAESKENLESFEAAGLTRVVRKPFHTEELKKEILDIIGEDSIRLDDTAGSMKSAPPPPPTFRPATTISMDALDKAFHKTVGEVQNLQHQSPPPPAQVPKVPPPPPVQASKAPPPPPPVQTSKALPPPPAPMVPSTQSLEVNFDEVESPQPEKHEPQHSISDTMIVSVPPIPRSEVTETVQFDDRKTEVTTSILRRTPPPPPPPVRRIESQISPLVSHKDLSAGKHPKHSLPHAPKSNPTQPESSPVDELQIKNHSEIPKSVSPEFQASQVAQPPPPPSTRQATAPAMSLNLASATLADAEVRREIKEWVAAELPKIARDIVKEELQKLLNK